ncbi:tRNA pseudouridine synthase 1 [Ascosphaera pollenicola]|nr:tRNA pseudouridine synthase 1 [Ascosphaera pollenicola]
MDLANSLIRMVVRSFYETRYILIIDSLFIHSVHVRSEIRDGQTRPVNQEYYYIPLHPVIDAIKYRVSKLTSDVKAQFTPQVERKEYICRRCRAEWTQLEVLGRVGAEGFECDRCGYVLDRADEIEGALVDRSGHEKNSKLMSQLDGILKLLKRIDSVQIPANDFDFAWERKVDVIRDKDRNPATRAPIVVTKKGATVKGVSTTDASSVEVNLYSNAEKGAAELAETEKRKAELEKQNALPSWITTSAISTEASASVKQESATGDSEAGTGVKAEVKSEAQENALDESLNDKVAAYYAAMAAEEEAQRVKEAESDAGSSDDEDDFEDVDFSASATPAESGMVQSETPSLKRDFDELEVKASQAPSEAATPSVVDEPPTHKRLKTEDVNEDENTKEEEQPPAAPKNDAQSDEDDEDEFEDV